MQMYDRQKQTKANKILETKDDLGFSGTVCVK